MVEGKEGEGNHEHRGEDGEKEGGGEGGRGDPVDVALSIILNERDLMDNLEKWAKENCERLRDPDAEEFEHGYFDLYNEYVALFETMVTDKLEDARVTAPDLYQRLKAKNKEGGGQQAQQMEFLTMMLLQMVDFNAFIQMMKEERRKQLGRADYTFDQQRDGDGNSNGGGGGGGGGPKGEQEERCVGGRHRNYDKK